MHLGAEELSAVGRRVGEDVSVHSPVDLVHQRQRNVHAPVDLGQLLPVALQAEGHLHADSGLGFGVEV